MRIDLANTPGGYTFCDPTQGQWGCGYTDGFRVPLLVVSPYTKAGTISGACGNGELNQCPYFGPPSFTTQYVHDFGSILRYTELNFGMPYLDQADGQYADYNAPDNQNGNVPLSELLTSPARAYTPINPPYPYQCFTLHENTGGCPLAVGNWSSTPPDSY